jgi:hypothetical protein
LDWEKRAVRGIDPETAHYFDDTRRYIDNAAISSEDKQAIFEDNTRRVFSRLMKKIRQLDTELHTADFRDEANSDLHAARKHRDSRTACQGVSATTRQTSFT